MILELSLSSRVADSSASIDAFDSRQRYHVIDNPARTILLTALTVCCALCLSHDFLLLRHRHHTSHEKPRIEALGVVGRRLALAPAIAPSIYRDVLEIT